MCTISEGLSDTILATIDESKSHNQTFCAECMVIACKKQLTASTALISAPHLIKISTTEV